jgi:hypothetical protein
MEAWASQNTEASAGTPVISIPKVAAPPKMDGKIEDGEWAGAAMITGFWWDPIGGAHSLAPRIQQSYWYVAYDDKYLHLAMRSPHPKGTYPVARGKRMDDRNTVLFEDHVEIQLTPHERKNAAVEGKGFYKIMVNPKGTISDEHYYCGTPGSELLWSSGGVSKCHVTETYWDLELSVEIARLRIPALEGRGLIVQLTRTDGCAGIQFTSLVGAGFMSWDQFAEFRFSGENPIFQLRDIGDIGSGQLDANIALTGVGSQPQPASVEVEVLDADGKTVFKKKKEEVTVGKNETKMVRVAADNLPISEPGMNERNRRNRLKITATSGGGSQARTLYKNTMPFMKHNEEYSKKYLEPWIKGRPQSGDWESKLIYMPYSGKIETSVDLDFFGIAEKVLTARSFQVQVAVKGGKTVLAKAEGPIEKAVGAPLLMDAPALPEGELEAAFVLRDGAGAEVARKTVSFRRKKFAWERNNLGRSTEVIPPYRPIEMNGKDALGVLGRVYTIGANGMLSQIQAMPPTGDSGGPENLLKSPMRFEMRAQGKDIVGGEASGGIVKAEEHQAETRGSQQLDQVKLSAKSLLDYDGWYETELKIEPQGAVPCDALDLVVGLRDEPGSDARELFPVDTLYVHRLSDGFMGNALEGVPRKPGVHFASNKLMKYWGSGTFDWKSFVPVTYVGSGDRGLSFYAWSAAGWELSDEQPAVSVERLPDGNARLRIRLLAGPVVLEKPRTIRFAFLASPVRFNHNRFRTILDEGAIVHDTAGYRWYGNSVDGFVLDRDEGYDALRRHLIGTRQYTVNGAKYFSSLSGAIRNGAKIQLYGSSGLTGAAGEEFRTFCGEWLGNSTWQADGNTREFQGHQNMQQSLQWNNPEQFTVVGINWTASYNDFYVWYHRPLIEKCGLNGTWWDNSALYTVYDYNSELGGMEHQWNLKLRRELMKRLNVVGWEAVRPPAWIINAHDDVSWNQKFWMVEQDWGGSSSDDVTPFDYFQTIDRFRAMTRCKSVNMITDYAALKAWGEWGFGSKDPEKQARLNRALVAMSLLHDIHYQDCGMTPARWRRLKLDFQALANLSDSAACLFTGYWRTGNTVKPGAAEIAVSTWANSSLKTAVILLANTKREDQYLAGTLIDINRLIPVRGEKLTARRVYDLETGDDVKLDFAGGQYRIAEPFPVRWHDFRMIGVVADGGR